MNTDEYKVRPDLHLSIIHNWPLNLLVWCCGLYSEGKGLISIPESAQVSGLHKVHLSFKMNVENVEGKSVRRRKVGRDAHLIGSALIFLQAWFHLWKTTVILPTLPLGLRK